MSALGAACARRAGGFTLIEVVLAMAITAFVALLAYTGLHAAINAAERHQWQMQRLGEVQLAMSVLERDLRHTIARPVVDEYGDLLPALSGGVAQDYLLRLTRRGWDNPRELPRGELQRLRYQLEDNQLYREYWPLLDRISEQDGLQRQLLIDGVLAIELRFLDTAAAGSLAAAAQSAGQSPGQRGEWVDDWPHQRLPGAVEVALELEQIGWVRRVFALLHDN